MRLTLRAFALTLALVGCAALLLGRWTPGSSEETGWREAVDRLAREKTLAEGCASVLKTFGDRAPMARLQGERLFARAKADVDGLVMLLVSDLPGERSPAEIPDLRYRLEAVPKQRQALCRHAEAAVGTVLRQAPEGTRAADLLAEGSGDGANAIIEAAVRIWRSYRDADQIGREAIVSRIESARWLAYPEVPGA